MATKKRYQTNKEFTLSGTLAAASSGAKQTINIAVGEGATRSDFPGYKVVLYAATVGTTPQEPEDDPNREYMFVVSHPAGDTLEVLRGMEGTTATNHDVPGTTYKIAVVITSTDYDGARPYVTPQDFGAPADGVTNDAVAANDANTAAAAIGVPVFWPAGDYVLESGVTVTTDHFGEGPEDTRIFSGTGFSDTGLFKITGDDVSVRNMRIDMSHANACIYGEPPASEINERCSIENIRMVVNHVSAFGINLQAPSGGRWKNLEIRNIHCVATVTSTTGHGILVSAGTATSDAEGLVIEGCYVDGFLTGINVSGTGTHSWSKAQIITNHVVNSVTYGVRCYHVDGLIFSGNIIDGSEAGIWADNGSSERYAKIVHNDFRNILEIAVLTEEWGGGVIGFNSFESNKRDIFFSGCAFSTIVGNTSRLATEWSINTDRDWSVTGASGQTYLNNHPAANFGCAMIGNTIVNAGEDGVIIAGDQDWIISGNNITKSGISHGGTAETSGYADLRFKRSGGASDNGFARVTGNVFGNTSVGIHSVAGKSQYGVIQEQGMGSLAVVGNSFSNLEDAVDLYGSGSGFSIVEANFFSQCNDVRPAHGIGSSERFRLNLINGGTLATDPVWNHDWRGHFSHQGNGLWNFITGILESEPADGDLEPGQVVWWGDDTGGDLRAKWKNVAGTTVRTYTIAPDP